MKYWKTLCCFILGFIIPRTYGVIYRLNGTEYERLPRITVIDDYEECMYHTEALYCTTELELVSDSPSELLSFIQNYSERKLTHFNYSRLYRGICVTKTCNISKQETFLGRNNALERCLNNTLWKKYKLKTRLTSTPMCYPKDEDIELEKLDIFIAVLCISLIILNVAATFYDLSYPRKEKYKGVSLFLAFSISRNWFKLHQNDNRTKPNVERLNGLDGLRALMMISLAMGHCIFPLVTSVSNTRFIEEANGTREINDCRRHWKWSLMYMTNYKDDTRCMMQTWYLAADMHLYCLGVVILVLVQNNYWRKVVLLLSLLIGIITPAIPTYIHNLDTLYILTPESTRNYALEDPAFDYLYKRTYTNIANYVIGLITGIYLHQWQKSKFDIRKYRNFVVLYWASIPIGIAMIISNKVFLRDGLQLPLYLRILFQMFARPILATLFVILIIGMAFKLEGVYRQFFEWDGWTWVARISYSLHVTHLTLYRVIIGNSTSLFKISYLTVVPVFGLTLLATIISVAFWLILEAPMNQIVKVFFEASPRQMNNNIDDKKK